MNIEQQLFEIIKDKELKELKKYFIINNIQSKDFCNFNKILLNFIENNASIEIIRYIIEQQNDKENVKPLFNSIQKNNFEVANLLINYGANINGRIRNAHNYKNKARTIIKFLVDSSELNMDNLIYIINHDFDMNLITEGIIQNLIKQKRNDLINCILKFNQFKRGPAEFIFMNVLLFDIYRNKKALSNKQLNKLLYYNNDVIFNISERNNCGCSLFLKVILDENMELVKLFINYAKARDIDLNLNEKDDFGRKLFLIAIENDNMDIIRLLI
eukprot:jgi/Orpsp1_1/1174808/evm.model.c7180000051503.2